ncbi:hypothetical protein Tsp_13695, partial [Trichinella spiralis]|uniref:hypothetical protein n=1 Tax=Trichinella spiralis TaxID=6334 RepID=UPI0001EFD62F
MEKAVKISPQVDQIQKNIVALLVVLETIVLKFNICMKNVLASETTSCDTYALFHTLSAILLCFHTVISSTTMSNPNNERILCVDHNGNIIYLSREDLQRAYDTILETAVTVFNDLMELHCK